MSRRGKPAALAVPTKPADEAPEATPRTIEGGPTVEPDAYGIYHAANTPVGHSGSRGSRAAFTAAGTTENRAEQLLISQMQTPERHRGQGGTGGQAGGSSYLMASPLPNMSSPGGLYPSPNPVPLFQPSPKRQTGMLSPGAHQHTGFEAMFQSPMRGFNSELQVAADLLRFDTPSRQAALDSLISPSPNKHARRILPGSQGRSRASSRAAAFDVARWRQAEEAAGLAAAGAGDDADFDLVKNLLQSPGPKEVQNLQQEHQRSKLGRSTSSTPAGSPWSASEAAAAAAGGEGAARAAAHVRRRALDFSKAEQMHRDLAVLPNLRSRGGKPGASSSSGALSGLAYGAAAFGEAASEQHHLGSSRDLDQRQQQDQKQSRFQPDLPLLPLDLSECERHNPSSTTGLTPKDPFTRSPRTKLDDAAAVVAGGAMHALRSLHSSSSSSEEQQRRALDPVLRSLARLPGGYSASNASKLRAAATAAAAAVSPGKLPVMVPLDNLSAVAAAGAGNDIATQVLQLLQGDPSLQEQELGLQDVKNLFDDHPSEEEYQLEQQQQADDSDADAAAGRADAEAEDEEQQHAGGGSAGKAAAGRGRSGSAGKQQRTSARRPAAAAAEQPQPSRRSRRIARSTPDAAEQREERTTSPPLRSSSGNRSRKTVRRTADAASEQEEQEEQQQYDQDDAAAAAAMDVDDKQEEQQQQLALAAAAEAAAADEEADEAAEEEGTARTRSRSGSGRKSSGKKSSRNQQQQQSASSQQGSDATAGDPEATAAAAAASMAAAAGLDASALAQQAAMFPGLQTLAHLQMLQKFGVTPDKARSRLPGGLLGPGTPDEVRLAHMGLQFTASMRSCHCKKSQCLKLYCDCFANTTYCNGCACVDCKNVEANAQEVMAKRSTIQQRDPNAFTHKLAQRADTLTNRKGCKCKKSHCLKKYCECYQLGVRCGDLCKCSDCHNVGEIEGALPIPTAALLQHSALMSAASSSQQQRMQHAAAAAAGPYWSQLGQALPAVSAGAAATPSTSVGMAQAQAQAQLLLRLQNSGQPGTPCSAPLVGGLALQPSLAAGGAATAACDFADGTSAEPGGVAGSSGAATPLAAVASTPQPPKSAGRLSMSVDKSSLRSTAKPLLPEFMQAAAAAAAGKEAGGSSTRQGMLLRTSAAAAEAAAEDQLPTPDQAGAEQHVLQMRDTSSELEPGAAAAAAATAEAVVAAAAAAAAAHQQYDAATLAAMPLQHPDYAGQQQQQAHGLYGSPMQDPSAKQLQQQQRSPARVRASASTSSGGDSRAGPVSSAVPGSVTSKGRHRLAASSRACEDEASTGDVPQQQQQQQQHHALAALVSGTAAAAAGLTAGNKPGGGQFSNARRQLLQQIQEEAAGLSDFSGVNSWPPEQQQQQQGVDGYGTLAQPAPAAAAAGVPSSGADCSPGQPVMLGPNGPMVVLPQHVLRSAMSQAAAAAALNLTAMPSAADPAAADGSGEEQQAATGVPRQTTGMLMTVTDAQGCVQFFFLPNSQAGASAGAHQEPAADDPMQVDQSPAAAAAAAADASRQQHCDQQQQQTRMSTRHHPLPPSQQQQPQQFTTPTKSYPADEDDLAAAGGRSLRSSSAAAAGGGGGSCRTTPSKRTTPIKRKAEGEDATPGSSPQQFGPSPAKLPHQLASPPGVLAQAQVSPSQPVVLSPVKLTARALAASGGAPEGAFSSRRPQRSISSSSLGAQSQPPQPPEMQLFLATTADGQQLLLRAPAGTDPDSLIGADGSVQSCYLAAVLDSTPALASQQYLQQQRQLAAEQFVQQQQYQQQQQLSPSSRQPVKQLLQVNMPAGGGAFASPSKGMSSPGKLSSPTGLLRFSPGSKTVFSPKGSSPSKPLLGNSPGRV